MLSLGLGEDLADEAKSYGEDKERPEIDREEVETIARRRPHPAEESPTGAIDAKAQPVDQALIARQPACRFGNGSVLFPCTVLPGSQPEQCDEVCCHSGNGCAKHHDPNPSPITRLRILRECARSQAVGLPFLADTKKGRCRLDTAPFLEHLSFSLSVRALRLRRVGPGSSPPACALRAAFSL